jgi:hypothetical protein
MPLYIVSIHKRDTAFAGAGFVNRYHVNAANPAAAVVVGQSIIDLEIPIMANTTFFDKITVVLPHVRGGGTVVGVEAQGTRAPNGGILPPWNVVRADFPHTTGSRPDRKYLRIGLGQEDITGQVLNAGIITLVQASYAVPLVALGSVVGPGGQPYAAGPEGIYPYVQMRQTHRERRARAGFHRGWVPNP